LINDEENGGFGPWFFAFLGKRNVIIDIEFLRMDKYDEYKAIEDTLTRIVELKALRDQATDPVERRRLQKQMRDLWKREKE